MIDRLAENFRLPRLDWFAVGPAKPCCVDEKDSLKANVMRTCSAPVVTIENAVVPMGGFGATGHMSSTVGGECIGGKGGAAEDKSDRNSHGLLQHELPFRRDESERSQPH